jgi:YihY family inner membrane protein
VSIRAVAARARDTFAFAVVRKYSRDNAGLLAAAITYYAFLSVFPLLLAFASILGFALRGDPQLQHKIVGSTLAQLPVIGPELRVGNLHGSGLGLVLGFGAALWAGMRAFLTAEQAMSELWGVEQRGRLSFVTSRLRALAAAATLGAAGAAAFALGSLGSVASAFLSLVLAFAVFWVGFRVLTLADVGWRGVLPGAAAAAVAYELLQQLGGLYVRHVLAHASETYGTFALVIGLLSWIFLVVEVALLSAEVNVVVQARRDPLRPPRPR